VYRSGQNLWRPIEIRCALAEIDGLVMARKIVDLHEDCRAKARYSFCPTAHVCLPGRGERSPRVLGLSMLKPLQNFNYAGESTAETY
jgi:hypothetical protein